MVVAAVGVYFLMGRVSRIGQMTTEQIMKMTPQSAARFQYCYLHTMRETAGLQEWYNDIVSQSLSSGLIDPNSIDYLLWADSLIVLGGRFDFESIRKSLENYTMEEYKGYQIFKQYYSGIVLFEDKIVSGDTEAVKNFIDVLKGDKASMDENSVYDEIKSEITGGFIISIGKPILSSYGAEILGYSVNQTGGGMGKVKTVYVFDNQNEATEVLENLENRVRTFWIGGGSAIIEQRGKMIVVTITLSMQSVRDLIGWVTGSTAAAEELMLTFQNSVSWSAVREDNENITVSYNDITGNTISVNVKIENSAGQIENETNFQNTSAFSFTWHGAESSVTYRVILTVQHDTFGEVSETKFV